MTTAFRWVVSAYPAAPVATGGASDPFQVDEEVRPLPVDYASLAALSERALPVDADEAPDAVPVFIPAHVLAEAAAQAQAAGDVETGGVLVGKLRRDDGAPAGTSPALFVEVTAQVPARHTVATATRLTFTAETWAAVRAAIALRRGGELLLGWWHAHVDFCRVRGCPPERRALCTAADPFLSAEDLLLHATMFGSAYQLALLVRDSTARGQTCSLYGWSHGMVRRRGFHLVKGEIDAAHVPAGF